MKRSKWCVRCLKAPQKALTGFRNLYIKGMNGCARRMQYPMGAVGYPTVFGCNSLSPNFSMKSGIWSTSSGDEDIKELIRANLVGIGNEKTRREGSVGRSQSVVVGRIDEDEEVDFSRDDEMGVVSNLLLPKSRSLAAPSKRRSIRAFA